MLAFVIIRFCVFACLPCACLRNDLNVDIHRNEASLNKINRRKYIYTDEQRTTIDEANTYKAKSIITTTLGFALMLQLFFLRTYTNTHTHKPTQLTHIITYTAYGK